MAHLDDDPGFVRAVEGRYLRAALHHLRAGAVRADAHRSSLAAALHGADPTNGGLRYRALRPEIRAELEARLLRFLERAAQGA